VVAGVRPKAGVEGEWGGIITWSSGMQSAGFEYSAPMKRRLPNLSTDASSVGTCGRKERGRERQRRMGRREAEKGGTSR